MKKMIQLVALSAVTSTWMVAGGYKLPEQSLNSMALGAAYVAHTDGADTAYFNPANMAFMDGSSYVDGSVTLVHLPSNVYTSDNTDNYDGKSKVENILVPNIHYVAKPMGDWRWGVSLVAPGGLSKRWDTLLQKAKAEEFTLKTLELNPSFAYKISDTFSVGGGIRLIYAEGVVKGDPEILGLSPIRLDMKGDTFEVGYNLALAYKPINDIEFGATYRSEVKLGVDGTAIIPSVYDDKASVSVPLPAALNLSIAKTWNDSLTLEFNYERTYWSAYKELDFVYTPALSNAAPYYFYTLFDAPKPKNWSDTNTFRLGGTYKYSDTLTLMAGFAIDEAPNPDTTLGFELPDSDAKIYSLGFRYKQSEQLSWGIAMLYDDKESRRITATAIGIPGVSEGGTFTQGGAFLTTVGISYKY